MAWLLRRAAIVEVIVNDPGSSKSGTCDLCASYEGMTLEEAGIPALPVHPHCKCTLMTAQDEEQPEVVLEETFSMTPGEVDDREEGGVEEL